MFRVLRTATSRVQRAAATVQCRQNSNDAAAAERAAELEREKAAREDAMRKMAQNSFFGRFMSEETIKRAAAAGAGAKVGSAGGAAPFGSRNFANLPGAGWAANPIHTRGRFFAGLIIVVASFMIMRRMGMTGDYTRLQVPYWATDPADEAKWILYTFNVSAARRAQLQQQFFQNRGTQPQVNFFDFVDANEPQWRSSAHYSPEQVVAAVKKVLRAKNGPQGTAMVRNGLNGGKVNFSQAAAGSMPEERAQRIDALMAAIAPVVAAAGAIGPGTMVPIFGGGGAPPVMGGSGFGAPQGGFPPGAFMLPPGAQGSATPPMFMAAPPGQFGQSPAWPPAAMQAQQHQAHQLQQGHGTSPVFLNSGNGVLMPPLVTPGAQAAPSAGPAAAAVAVPVAAVDPLATRETPKQE